MIGKSLTVIWKVSFIKHPKALVPVKKYVVVVEGLKFGD